MPKLGFTLCVSVFVSNKFYWTLFGKIKQFYESKSKVIYAIKMIIINTFSSVRQRDFLCELLNQYTHRQKWKRIEKKQFTSSLVLVVINICTWIKKYKKYCERIANIKYEKIFIAQKWRIIEVINYNFINVIARRRYFKLYTLTI